MRHETTDGVKKTYDLLQRNHWANPQMGWGDEPDRADWIDPKTGYACLALRGGLGSWCGYVSVPKGHPVFLMPKSEAEHFDVHGGVTFVGPCYDPIEKSQYTQFAEFRHLQPDAINETGIKAAQVCHDVDANQKEVRWIGFDCSHLHDQSPHKLAQFPDIEGVTFSTYKTLDYVMTECADLARQIASHGQ